MSEIIKFDEISFVSDEEIMKSKEYKEMFEEVKENLNTKKIKEIVNNIEKISIENTIIYKVKNNTEFTALHKYYLEHGMEFQDGWIEDFTYDFMILLDNSGSMYPMEYVAEKLNSKISDSNSGDYGKDVEFKRLELMEALVGRLGNE